MVKRYLPLRYRRKHSFLCGNHELSCYSCLTCRQTYRKIYMDETLTEELLDELLTSPTISSFVDHHDSDQRTLSQYLNELLELKGLKRSEVVKAAGLNETFGYQIFTGARGAKRDKVLQIAFAMRLDLKETARLLRAAGANELYCKNRRDAIIIFSLNKGFSLQKVNEELYLFGEDTIC